MTYDIPELHALTAAIDAISIPNIHKANNSAEESDLISDLVASYEEWE